MQANLEKFSNFIEFTVYTQNIRIFIQGKQLSIKDLFAKSAKRDRSPEVYQPKGKGILKSIFNIL